MSTASERVTEFLRQFERLRDTGGWISSVHADPECPEGATLTSADLHEVLKAANYAPGQKTMELAVELLDQKAVHEARLIELETAAAEFAERSEKLFETMQNMVGKPDTTPYDVVRYGAYASEAQCAAAMLRVRAAKIRAGQV